MIIDYKKGVINGNVYTQSLKVSQKTLNFISLAIKKEIELNYINKDKYIFDDYNINYLYHINKNITLLTLTQLRFIYYLLSTLDFKNKNITLKRLKKNRNTLLYVG
jgi:hypothetical protein